MDVEVLEIEGADEAGTLDLVNVAKDRLVWFANVAEGREVVEGVDANYFACVDHRQIVSFDLNLIE